MITVIWSPPLFPNGQLLGYKLIVVKSDNRNVLREVSPNTLSWTFNQLQPLHTYTIKVSAWNSHGEGPADTLEITTPEPTPGTNLRNIVNKYMNNKKNLHISFDPKPIPQVR